MTVSIDIGVADKADAIVVPAGAVREPQSPDPWVLVAEGGHAVRRTVQTGARTASEVEVRRGLEPGERVIVTPGVRPGARVSVR
jgi:HlyD family secretion protein